MLFLEPTATQLEARLARTEEALRRARADLEEVQGLARLGFWEWDIHGDVVRWTDELYRMFDVPRAVELNYATYLAAVFPGDRAATQAVVARAMSDAFWPNSPCSTASTCSSFL